MKRLALVAVIAIVFAVTALAWSHKRERIVRVGGMTNACTCTQRIEP
jgi:hypothetical protein